MGKWQHLVQSSRDSASALVDKKHHRSAISRAYYAAYAKVTDELLNYSISLPTDWEGPAHQKLRRLIEGTMTKMALDKRQALSQMVGRLYALRLAADYRPSTSVEGWDARQALSLMKKIIEAF